MDRVPNRRKEKIGNFSKIILNIFIKKFIIQELSTKDMSLLVKIIYIVKSIIRIVYPNLNNQDYSLMNQIFDEMWDIIKYFLKKYTVKYINNTYKQI
jgi:hypothetical protein